MIGNGMKIRIKEIYKTKHCERFHIQYKILWFWVTFKTCDHFKTIGVFWEKWGIHWHAKNFESFEQTRNFLNENIKTSKDIKNLYKQDVKRCKAEIEVEKQQGKLQRLKDEEEERKKVMWEGRV